MAYQSEIEKLEARFEEKPEQWFAALADAYRKNKDLDLALDILNTWLEKRPNYTSGHIVRGRVLLDRGEDAAASGAFERVLELDGENIIAIRALSEIAERTGDLHGAQDWLKRLLDVDPMNEEAEEAMERLKAAAPQGEESSTEPPETTESRQKQEAAEAELVGVSASQEEPAEPSPVPEVDPLGFEPTVMDEPESVASDEATPEQDFVVERASQTDLDATVPMEGLAVEESPELSVERASAAMDLGVEVETTSDEALPDAEKATAPETAMVPEEGTAAPGDELGLSPFDDSLEWGTGEGTSRAVTQEDVEEAALTHEDAVAPAGAFIPGVEGSEFPDVGTEGRDVPQAADEGADAEILEQSARPAEASAASGEERQQEADVVGGDLELIMPEEVGTEPEAEQMSEAAAEEAEPVVTETLADLYAKQGHRDQALEIYRQLLESRPGDAALEAKIAGLEQKHGAPAAPARPLGKRERYSVAVTGGQSAQEYVQRILGGTAVTREEASEATPMDEAFGGDAGGDPTQPAKDDLSLGTVFGDEPEAAPPSASGVAPAGGSGAGGGFSFDEFFGAEQQGTQEQADAAASPEKQEQQPPERGEGDFKDWLKGLKT